MQPFDSGPDRKPGLRLGDEAENPSLYGWVLANQERDEGGGRLLLVSVAVG